MKKENKELKNETQEKVKVVKKSSYSKKKKLKKNVFNGISFVQTTFNNTIVKIADTN